MAFNAIRANFHTGTGSGQGGVAGRPGSGRGPAGKIDRPVSREETVYDFCRPDAPRENTVWSVGLDIVNRTWSGRRANDRWRTARVTLSSWRPKQSGQRLVVRRENWGT
ncbi:hypothetical protein Bbelb_023080 [Branchiostoma belcheri]|nr:hypothetical protein Bbelb_023080 [Branchiostoma belcheri]